jgi:hypothetical protein
MRLGLMVLGASAAGCRWVLGLGGIVSASYRHRGSLGRATAYLNGAQQTQSSLRPGPAEAASWESASRPRSDRRSGPWWKRGSGSRPVRGRSSS